MEDSKIFPQNKEHVPMAHKLETPSNFVSSLRDAAEKIGNTEEKDFVANLVGFKQGIIDYMRHFDISSSQVESFSDSKKQIKGGFGKRAVQKDPAKGVNGLRLVRDNLSDNVFLKIEEVDLYANLLNKKLFEETQELTEAANKKERVEELGDVLEVFQTILSSRGIDENLIERKRQALEVKIRREERARRKLSTIKSK